jgi:hypothetical protein
MSHLLGLLHGREETFPPALLAEVNARGTEVHAETLIVSSVEALERAPYRVLVDRISNRVGYFRSLVLQQRMLGVHCVPDPGLFSLDRVALAQLALQSKVAAPATLLLAHNNHPPAVESDDLGNLAYPLPWEQYLHRVGLPGWMRSAGLGGGPVQSFATLSELWQLYGGSGHTLQVIQPDFSEAQRVLVLVAGQHLEALGYEPVTGRHFPVARELAEKAVEATARLQQRADLFLTGVEFSWHRSQLWLTDLHLCPDLEWWTLGEDSFTRIVHSTATELIRRTRESTPASPRDGARSAKRGPRAKSPAE